MIQLYLNECGILSLHEAGIPLLRIYENYSTCKDYCSDELWKDSAFYRQPAFFHLLNHSNVEPQWRGLLREFYYGSEPLNDWRGARRRSNTTESYLVPGTEISFTDVTVAEAAENSIVPNEQILLLSIEGSKLGSKEGAVEFKRSDGVSCTLYNVINSAAAVLSRLRGIYSESAERPPKPFETILGKDLTRFRRINRRAPKGAVFYEEMETGRLYYLDTFHRGLGAHLEVFSAVGVHLGEAAIDTAIIAGGTSDATKDIVL